MLTYNLEAFQARLDALNRLLDRHGIAPAVITGTEHVWIDVPADEAHPWPTKRQAWEVDIQLPVAVIRYNGFIVRGRLVREQEGDMITRIGKHSADLNAYRDMPIACDHCRQTRVRKGAWILERESDSSLVSIGDSCAEEYLGVNALALLADAEDCAKLGSDDDDEPCFGVSTVRIGSVLAAVSAALLAWQGYRSRARYDDESTGAVAEAAAYALTSKGIGAWYGQAWWEEHAKAQWEHYMELIPLAREWWEKQESTDEFTGNCKTAMMGLNPRHASFIACGMKLYLEARGIIAKPGTESYADSYMGVAGEKFECPCVFVSSMAVDGSFGTTYKLTFRGPNGECLVWWASKAQSFSGTVNLKGTVKGHSEYKGVKVTTITRCKEIK